LKSKQDLALSFMLQGGNMETRKFIWQAIHFFCQDTAATNMPADILYPGLVDPGVNVALPFNFWTYQGLIHLLSCLTVHPSGVPARGAATTLEIIIQGQPNFSIVM
jgi:hypothetical protein